VTLYSLLARGAISLNTFLSGGRADALGRVNPADSRLRGCPQTKTTLAKAHGQSEARLTIISLARKDTERNQRCSHARTRGGSRRISRSCRSWCARLSAPVPIGTIECLSSISVWLRMDEPAQLAQGPSSLAAHTR